MHQMRISTNEVSSVVLEPKKLEVRKKSKADRRIDTFGKISIWKKTIPPNFIPNTGITSQMN